MGILLAGLLLFFSSHLFSAMRPRLADADIRLRMGDGPYRAIYSLVALAGFVLIVWGYGAARPDSSLLYAAPVWGRHLNYILMPLALIALVSAYVPTGRIKKALKHPMLVAVKIWALGHLLANGDLASVLLFGSFLVFAVIDRIAVKRRGETGPPPDAPVSAAGDLIAVLAGLGIAALIILWLHPVLFGVAVWPPA